MRRRRIAGFTAVAASLALAACGGDEAGEPGAVGQQPAAPAAASHVHGLGINPSDGSLIVATHDGLLRAAKDEQRAVPYGESRQDVMGFSILGPDRFVGSGHPDPREADQPPNLGLIRSGDGGRSWSSVSLLGEADFHVLESEGRRVYGFDGTQGRLMVSRDGGERWVERQSPAAVFALAIDPRDARRVVASTEQGVFASADEGATWRSLTSELAGLLAWPAKDRLVLMDGSGTVQTSRDGGRTWRTVGSIGGQPAALIASGDDLYAALGDGSVQRSGDGGANWQVRATP